MHAYRLLPRGAAALAAMTLSAMACSRGTSTVSTGDVARSESAVRWTANLTPESGSATLGSVSITPLSEDRTRVLISVRGAPPNRNLPWHIHRGVCGAGGLVVGSATSYPMLGTAGDGRAQLQVDLLMRPPTVGAHYVDVHASIDDPTVIACGDLDQD